MPDHASSHTVEALYTDHHGWLHRWLGRKLGCAHRAADLAQDTFVRVLTSRRPNNLRAPRAYLTTIARNLLADHWRRLELERAYQQALAHLPECEAPPPEIRLQMLHTLMQVDTCLQALPAVARQVFLLSQLDGMAYAEIATELKLSLSTVKRHMSRGFLACLSIA